MRSSQTVDILLATYNGAAYLEEQLESLLAQTHQEWHVFARDDGSSDRTAAILDAYAKAYPARFTLVRDGLKLGAKRAFSSLMAMSSAPYLAFCDQDDVWLPEKLDVLLHTITAAEAIYGTRMPLLVHSDLEVVDSKLAVIAPSMWAHQGIDPSRDRIAQLIVQNVVTGCASLFNRALRDVAQPVPPEAVMHDHWLALVASVRGKIISLPQTLVRYRQHGKNTLGAKKLPGLLSLPRKALITENWRLDYSDACAQASRLRAFLIETVPASTSAVLWVFANLYQYGWLKRRLILIRYGIFPACLRRQISVLLRV